MRYYTKEWYMLMQFWGTGGIFKKIPDRQYSDAEIKSFYNKALKKEILSEKRYYNTPPVLSIPDTLLSDENFCPEDWAIFDENDVMFLPKDAAEARRNLEAQFNEAKADFESRPPFNPKETTEWFHKKYLAGLRNARNWYPDWMAETTDVRLIALGLLPESTYNQYKSEVRKAKSKWNKLCKSAEKAFSRQIIPDSVEEAMRLHDAALLSLKKSNNDLIMIVCKDGAWSDHDTPYRKVVFRNAVILEKEKGLRVKKYMHDDSYWSSTSYLYHELYNSENGYEAHMMFATRKDLAYLTVSCSDICFEDGIKDVET